MHDFLTVRFSLEISRAVQVRGLCHGLPGIV